MKKIGCFYLILSAILILILNNFYNVFTQSHSWISVPLMLVGFTLAFMLLQIIALIAVILCTNVEKPIGKGNGLFRILLKYSLPIIIGAARVKVNFTDNVGELPKNKRMLFVCNHQHDFDPIIMLSVFPDCEIGFIGKKDIYESRPIVKRAMHRLSSLPIDRENDREAAKTIVKAIKLIKDDVTSIGLYPEGYTSKTCEFLPFRNGSFKIALKAKCPIVVCVINNTRAIPKNMLRRKTEIDFRCLQVINPEDFDGMTTAELGDMIHGKMEKEINLMRNMELKEDTN